ncbi:MAG: sodium:calcium antiporter [Patescibacteria group bacterium]
MSVLFELLLILGGIAIMLYGANLLVGKAAKFGRAKNWPPVLVGITVLAMGTSLPELIVSVLAAIQGHPLLAAGNIIGSNITNIGLIVGLAATLGEIKLSKKTVNYDIPLSIAPLGVLVFGFILKSTLTSYFGILLILAYFAYVGITAKEYERQEQTAVKRPRFTILDFGILLAGLAMLFSGGELTLHYSEIFFTRIGVSETVVGAVLLAFGTSFPELVATLTGVVKKNPQIAIGNILGSNVFNSLFVLGSTALFAPVQVNKLLPEIIFLGLMSGLFVLAAKLGRKHILSKSEGIALFFAYIVYVCIMTLIIN